DPSDAAPRMAEGLPHARQRRVEQELLVDAVGAANHATSWLHNNMQPGGCASGNCPSRRTPSVTIFVTRSPAVSPRATTARTTRNGRAHAVKSRSRSRSNADELKQFFRM